MCICVYVYVYMYMYICICIGREAAGYEGVHGGSGYGERNADGDRVLEFAVANDFVIGNTFIVKR